MKTVGGEWGDNLPDISIIDFLIWGNYYYPKLGPLVLLKEHLSKLENSWYLQFKLHLNEKQDYKEEHRYKMQLKNYAYIQDARPLK